jgi:hypothetical protein
MSDERLVPRKSLISVLRVNRQSRVVDHQSGRLMIRRVETDGRRISFEKRTIERSATGRA